VFINSYTICSELQGSSHITACSADLTVAVVCVAVCTLQIEEELGLDQNLVAILAPFTATDSIHYSDTKPAVGLDASTNAPSTSSSAAAAAAASVTVPGTVKFHYAIIQLLALAPYDAPLQALTDAADCRWVDTTALQPNTLDERRVQSAVDWLGGSTGAAAAAAAAPVLSMTAVQAQSSLRTTPAVVDVVQLGLQHAERLLK